MIKFKKSSTGHSYLNFQYGRVFIIESEKCITLKFHQTWKGQHSECYYWICLSIKSQKPIIYRFISGYGIKNITYQTTLLQEVDSLLSRVLSRKDKDKRERIKLKFLALCNQLFGERCDFQALNTKILRAWMPLLNYCEDVDALKIVPILKNPLVRQGFKQESLKQSITLWFGHSPKGLTKRIAAILEQKKLFSVIARVILSNLESQSSLFFAGLGYSLGCRFGYKKSQFFVDCLLRKKMVKIVKNF